jgi:hypothetical protein
MSNEITITVEVEMVAFMEGQIRPVDIPAHDLTGDPVLDLSAVYHYGQNDIQPKQFCSVSVGDIIRYQGRRYVVEPFGFAEVK